MSAIQKLFCWLVTQRNQRSVGKVNSAAMVPDECDPDSAQRLRTYILILACQIHSHNVLGQSEFLFAWGASSWNKQTKKHLLLAPPPLSMQPHCMVWQSQADDTQKQIVVVLVSGEWSSQQPCSFALFCPVNSINFYNFPLMIIFDMACEVSTAPPEKDKCP